MVDQETMSHTVVVEAMRIINEALKATSRREIVPANEMTDHFLELWSLLNPLLGAEA